MILSRKSLLLSSSDPHHRDHQQDHLRLGLNFHLTRGDDEAFLPELLELQRRGEGGEGERWTVVEPVEGSGWNKTSF